VRAQVGSGRNIVFAPPFSIEVLELFVPLGPVKDPATLYFQV